MPKEETKKEPMSAKSIGTTTEARGMLSAKSSGTTTTEARGMLGAKGSGTTTTEARGSLVRQRSARIIMKKK